MNLYDWITARDVNNQEVHYINLLNVERIHWELQNQLMHFHFYNKDRPLCLCTKKKEGCIEIPEDEYKYIVKELLQQLTTKLKRKYF
ncbi:unnamed protein product [marine sediment metagenome]|uniref:Uncharacterized protein n=1 Tax=marine sediment metagenome TaxID=412755 RepID=X1M967_9ZZZZ